MQGIDVDALEAIERERSGFPGLNATLNVALDLLIADANKLHDSLAASIFVFNEQHERSVEGQNPADVGGERAVKSDIDGTRDVNAGEGGFVAGIDERDARV